MLNFKNVNIIFLFIGLPFFVILKIDGSLSGWLVFLFLMIWFLFTIIGSFHIRWNFFLKGYHKNDQVKEKIIALTFDDGPNEEFTSKVLSLLREYNAKANFFCIGENVKKNPEVLKEIVKNGHLIGNHSYSHKNSFGFLGTKKVIEELKSTNKIIEEKTNLKVNFFRPPFGVTNPNIAKAVQKLNLYTFGWSIRSLDTIAKDSDKVCQKIISKMNNGDILLMHDSSELSVQVLEKLLQYFDQNHIKTITLDKLFNLKAYG